MKKVSFADIKKARKWALPAGVVALGFASIVVSQHGTDSSKAAVSEVGAANAATQATESPAPTMNAQVSVNGKDIPTDKTGSTSMDIPGGKAQVNVSSGHTQITTTNGGASGDTSNNNQSGNVDVNIDSQSGSGANWGSTQVYGYNMTSNNSSMSSSSTSVFSSNVSN